MITIHHLHRSRSFRVIWMMEELGLPYDLVCHDRGAGLAAPDSLREVYTLGRSPVIADDATVVFESGAILEYVSHRHGHGRLSVPCHHMDYAAYLTWLHAAEGTAMPALMPMLMNMMHGNEVSDARRNANEAVLRTCDDALAHRDHFGGGEFSAADIMMHTYIALAAQFTPAEYGRYARLPAWRARVEARAGYLRTQEVVEPDTAGRTA